MAEPILEMSGVSKSFGGNPVLQDVHLSAWPGEVHALVGENGAGKSTLMKILNGVYSCDGGDIRLNGVHVKMSNPHEARHAGISMIFQEHTLAEHLTVAENIFLGIEPSGPAGILKLGEMERRAGEIIGRCGFALDARRPVRLLSRAQKQMVEIARAIASATAVVVMDEPTAMLSESESERLYEIVADLKARGLAIIYISHRLQELARIADRITVLRGGRRVYSGTFGSVSQAEIIRHMVGRELGEIYPVLPEPSGDVALEVRGLTGREYRDIGFDLHRGEILGFAGLVGAGRTPLARGLFGLEPPLSGSIVANGKPVAFRRSADAIRAGLGFLTEDRKGSGIFSQMALKHNISMAALDSVRSGAVLDLAAEDRRCAELLRQLDVRAASPSQSIFRLSGGNQQKALMARWLFAGSRILLLDEPTQGVDVGARKEIYRLMTELAAGGAAILMISSDLPELLGMSHRIAVVRQGRIAAVVDARNTTQEEIMRFAALEST